MRLKQWVSPWGSRGVSRRGKVNLFDEMDREGATHLCSSVQSLDQLGRGGGGGDMRDDRAEILFRSFLQEAAVISSGMGRDVHSLMLSIQHFLCRPRPRSLSKLP